jgi:hypothetical protein
MGQLYVAYPVGAESSSGSRRRTRPCSGPATCPARAGGPVADPRRGTQRLFNRAGRLSSVRQRTHQPRIQPPRRSRFRPLYPFARNLAQAGRNARCIGQPVRLADFATIGCRAVRHQAWLARRPRRPPRGANATVGPAPAATRSRHLSRPGAGCMRRVAGCSENTSADWLKRVCAGAGCK